MYYLNHYVIDWDKVQSLDDVKRLLKALHISFEPNADIASIKDLVKLQDKPKIEP